MARLSIKWGLLVGGICFLALGRLALADSRRRPDYEADEREMSGPAAPARTFELISSILAKIFANNRDPESFGQPEAFGRQLYEADRDEMSTRNFDFIAKIIAAIFGPIFGTPEPDLASRQMADSPPVSAPRNLDFIAKIIAAIFGAIFGTPEPDLVSRQISAQSPDPTQPLEIIPPDPSHPELDPLPELPARQPWPSTAQDLKLNPPNDDAFAMLQQVQYELGYVLPAKFTSVRLVSFIARGRNLTGSQVDWEEEWVFKVLMSAKDGGQSYAHLHVLWPATLHFAYVAHVELDVSRESPLSYRPLRRRSMASGRGAERNGRRRFGRRNL